MRTSTTPDLAEEREIAALHEAYVVNVNALLADDREADAYALVEEFEADLAAVRLRQSSHGSAARARSRNRAAQNRYQPSPGVPPKSPRR